MRLLLARLVYRIKVMDDVVEAIRLVEKLDNEGRQQRTETLLGRVFEVEKEESIEL